MKPNTKGTWNGKRHGQLIIPSQVVISRFILLTQAPDVRIPKLCQEIETRKCQTLIHYAAVTIFCLLV